MSCAYRLAILNSHPIQYFAPFYRRLAQEPDIDLTVYFCSRQGVDEYVDAGFGARIKWDVPLLEGYKYKFLPNWRHQNLVAGFFSLINPSIIWELWRGNYDALLVYGHGQATCLIGIAAAKLLGVPVLMRSETNLLSSRPKLKRLLRGPVMTTFYRLCNACLPIGKLNADFYRFHGVDDKQLFLVPYALNNKVLIDTIEQARTSTETIKSELGIPSDKPVILLVSKLYPHKRPFDLLLAYQKLRAQGIKATLVFAGSGSSEEELKSYVKTEAVPDVCFLGFRNQSELPKVYAVADIFAFPSKNETWGLVVNEALCAGLPVVVTESVGAVGDLIKHGHNGFVYQTGDIDALAHHLKTLVTDTALRKQMGGYSRAIINRWDYEQGVEGMRAALHYVQPNRSFDYQSGESYGG